MAKLTLSDIVTFINDTAAKLVFQQNNDLIEAAMENTLSRDGTSPNTMSVDLDMNGQKVINTTAPVNDLDLATKKYVDDKALTLGTGDVIGPASSVDSDFALFDGTTGRLLKVGGLDTNPGLEFIGVNLRAKVTAGIQRIAAGLGLDINGLTEDTAPVSGDFVATYDTSTSTIKKIDISKLGSGNVTLSVVHTSDTALATRASGGSQIGTTLSSKIIPTSGVIRVTLLEAEFDETGGAASTQVAFALDVGGTKVWAASDDKDGLTVDMTVEITLSTTSRLISVGQDTNGSEGAPKVFSLDIAAHSLPTGSQDVKIFMGDRANSTTGEATLTGTTVTCRLLIEIIDTT